MLRKNNLQLGLVIGLLAPLLGLLVVYFINFSSVSFFDFLDFFIHNHSLITSLGSLCLLANVAFFTIYINGHRDNTAKGIFLTTLIYGLTILVLKLF